SLSVIFIVFTSALWRCGGESAPRAVASEAPGARSTPGPRSLPLSVLVRGPYLQKISDFLFNSRPRAVQQDAPAPRRRPHHPRDLGVFVAFVIFQDKHLGGLFTELRDRAAQAIAQFAVPLLQFGTETRIGRQDWRHVVNRNGLGSRALAQ